MIKIKSKAELAMNERVVIMKGNRVVSFQVVGVARGALGKESTYLFIQIGETYEYRRSA